MDWIFLPPWSIRTLAAGALALATLLVVRAVRERRNLPFRRQVPALVMRLAAVAILLWIVLNPTMLTPLATAGKPALTVLVDTSYSMATSDVAGATRLDAALGVLKDAKTLAALEEHFELDVRRFDRNVEAVNLSALSPGAATGTVSDFAAAVSNAVADLAGRPSQAGVLLVGDGRATTAGARDAARLALARSVPLWTWCLGGEVPRRDLWIEVPAAEVLAFADAEVELTATLHQVGYPDRTFIVEVLHDGEVVAQTEAKPGPVKVKVTAPKRGETRYVYRVAHDHDEAEQENNERSVFLRAVGEKVRVLVVEGQPHWDTKFLVQCFKRNPRVDVTAIYRLGKGRQFAVISAGGEDRRETKDLFPRTADDFARYDVIVMGRGCETFFDEKTEAQLTSFVADRGGGLIFSRGKAYGGRFPALAKLEPVVWGSGVEQGVRLVPRGEGEGPVFELTAAGDLDTLIDRLPRFDQTMHTVGVKPLAVTLADGRSPGPGAPGDKPVVLAYHLYGQGRVVTLNASGLWRWSFREKGEDADEFVYDRFWMGLLRWLLSGSDFLAGHDVALRSDRRLYTDEQPMQFLIRTRGLDEEAYRPKLFITGPAGTTEVEPRRKSGGAYIAEAGPFPPGSYEVRLVNNLGNPKALTMTVETTSASIETRVLSADAELMGQLATISEGRTLNADDVPKLGRIFTEWRARKELADRKAPMWDRWWLLAAALLVLAAEWLVRRREGLL